MVDPVTGAGALAVLGTLSKPATTLIEKVSDAVGGIAKPWQINRVAKAEAEAEIIKANARVQISEIEERALLRMVREEGKKQENIESITAQAVPLLSSEAKTESLDNDWIVHLFEKARLVSNKDMQGVWARVLAGEANAPGIFSKRTVELVSTLDQYDMEIFTELCKFVWSFGDLVPLVFSHSEETIYNASGINFTSLTHLDAIGLIVFSGPSNFVRKRMPKRTQLFYYGTPVNLEFPNEGDDLFTGLAILTRAGQQLAPICGSKPIPEFFQYVTEKWLEANIAVSMPIEAKSTLGWCK